LDVLVDRLRGGVVQADGAALVAFFAQTQGGLLALLSIFLLRKTRRSSKFLIFR
jgi:hypothetical protein